MSVWPVVTEPIRGPEPVTPEPALLTATPPPPHQNQIRQDLCFCLCKCLFTFSTIQQFHPSATPQRSLLTGLDTASPPPPEPCSSGPQAGLPGELNRKEQRGLPWEHMDTQSPRDRLARPVPEPPFPPPNP